MHAFLTSCCVALDGNVTSFLLDSEKKVVEAFFDAGRDSGFAFGGEALEGFKFEVREGKDGWSVTATPSLNRDFESRMTFTATGAMPHEIAEYMAKIRSAA